jgi:hypothetical protein
MTLTDAQLSYWRELKSQFETNPTWNEQYEKVKAKRRLVQPQLGQLIGSFADGRISIDEFRATWDSKTRSEWKSFGLAGLSSAMFLNQLVKHLPDPNQKTQELRQVVRAPKDEASGRSRMQAFETFLEGQKDAGLVTKRQVQIARVPFFISAFWHLQNTELWPMFYVSARNVFQKNGLFTPKGSLVEDYFSFRDTYLSLMSALAVSAWDLEQICLFDYEEEKAIEPVEPDADDDKEDASTNDEQDELPSAHTEAQWRLATMGKSFNLKIWIAPNDRNKKWNGQRLGDMSLAELPPLGMLGEDVEKIVRLIDVLWLRSSGQIVAAFEIEHSTSIYSGLLRMADLTLLCVNIAFPLYIVAPDSRIKDVIRQLSRPSLQRLNLHNTCRFFSIEELAQNAEHIMKWTKDPDALKKLARKVKPIDEEEPQAE